MRIFVSVLTAAILTAGLAAAADTPTIPVTKDFVQGTLRWSQSGSMELRWSVVPIQGKAHLCGAVAHSQATTKRLNRVALRKGWLRQEGNKKKLITDLSFFTSVARNTDIGNAKASCKPIAYQGGKTVFELGFDPVRVRM
ncbi:hypothetical protein [Pacificoceanicola onchidii]|uniref:hypothetical protein n=1 Tax=Pacificoceanicola onchidii TaxID=2562685 RepID=UPI0010A38529|nr:hypothetical protein [Pacificoceanicola onchidii]